MQLGLKCLTVLYKLSTLPDNPFEFVPIIENPKLLFFLLLIPLLVFLLLDLVGFAGTYSGLRQAYNLWRDNCEFIFYLSVL